MLPHWQVLATEILQQVSGLDSVRVVVFHPALYGARLRFSRLMPEAHYVRLEGSAISRDGLRDQIDRALQHQRAPKAGQVALVVDEADRAEQASLAHTLQEFIRSDYFSRVFLFFRTLPTAIMSAASMEPAIHVVRPERADGEMTQPAASGASLDVTGFGHGQVLVNGRRISRWDGDQTRKLFFMLIDHAEGISREVIFEQFWPEASVKKATNVFHVTKTKIKSNLFDGDEYKPEVVQNVRGSYRLSTAILLEYDVAMFERLYAASEAHGDDSADAQRLLLTSLDVYRRDYLVDIRDTWADERRRRLRKMKANVLGRLGRHHRTHGDLPVALAYLLRATAQDPAREDIARDALELCAKLNRPDDAQRVFARLARTLDQQYQIAPGADLRRLAESIRSAN